MVLILPNKIVCGDQPKTWSCQCRCTVSSCLHLSHCSSSVSVFLFSSDSNDWEPFHFFHVTAKVSSESCHFSCSTHFLFLRVIALLIAEALSNRICSPFGEMTLHMQIGGSFSSTTTALDFVCHNCKPKSSAWTKLTQCTTSRLSFQKKWDNVLFWARLVSPRQNLLQMD